MHQLLPDKVSVGDETFTLNDLAGGDIRELIPVDTTKKLVKAFGETPANTISLDNYPRELYNLKIPGRDGTLNLAEREIFRDRQRKLPRYNDARRQLLLEPYVSIDELTSDPEAREKLNSVYTDIEQVDLLVGSMVDKDRPQGFAFGMVPYNIFLVMAGRRIFGDRFFMEGFNRDSYSPWGLDYVQTSNFRSILLRHFPEFEDVVPENPFLNWDSQQGASPTGTSAAGPALLGSQSCMTVAL